MPLEGFRLGMTQRRLLGSGKSGWGVASATRGRRSELAPGARGAARKSPASKIDCIAEIDPMKDDSRASGEEGRAHRLTRRVMRARFEPVHGHWRRRPGRWRPRRREERDPERRGARGGPPPTSPAAPRNSDRPSRWRETSACAIKAGARRQRHARCVRGSARGPELVRAASHTSTNPLRCLGS